jgi:anti-anti-sigma factor
MKQNPHSQTLPTEATTEIRWPSPRVAQVVLGGEHDLSTADELESAIAEALERCAKLIVDLRDAQFIDSSTIRILLAARRRAAANGLHFNLVLETTPVVERSLEITGVLEALNRVHTLDEALAQD